MNHQLFFLFIGLLSACSVKAQYWEHTYGGHGSDEARDVEVLSNGQVMVLGSTGSFGTGTSDFYSILIDPQGSIIWSKTFGGYGIDVGRSIAVSSAGILLVGFSNSHGAIGYNGYAILISDEGEIIWEESYGTENWDFFVKAVPLENGFILAGHRYGDDTLQGDAWVVRIDEAGGVVWSETIG